MVRKYEACILLKADLNDVQLGEELKFVEDTIKKSGEIVKIESLGVRNLAYPIKKKKEGFFSIFYFQSPPSLINEIKTKLDSKENILRYMIINRKRLPQKKEKDANS